MARRGFVPSVEGMNLLTRIFVFLAITCGASWLLKQVAVVVTGSQHSDSTLVGVLWGVGMLSYLLAAGFGTAVALRRLPVWARIIAAVVAVPVSFLALEALDAITEVVYAADGWFAVEIPLVVAALVMGALGIHTLGTARRA